MALALRRLDGTPFRQAAASALRKLVAVMRADDAAAAQALAERIHLVGSPAPASMPRAAVGALPVGRVLRIGYADRAGAVTARDIEPLGYVGVREQWYLIAWCRLRESVRIFRTDRITTIIPTRELAPARVFPEGDLDIPRSRRERLDLFVEPDGS
jgi:predicted DNA-binding transcriptional regulator YafY